MQPRSSDRRGQGRVLDVTLLLIVAALLLSGIVVTLSAWVCDDAYITFRTSANLAHGHGARWNLAERVQAYTNPLWMLSNSALFRLTGEFYYSSIVLSVVASLGAAATLAFGVARTRPAALVALVTLGLSKALVDFSTSGLENPLTHLLLGVFFALFLGGGRGSAPRRLTLLTLIASLGVVNRLDSALLYAPPLLFELARRRDRRALGEVLLGSLPFLAWELSSLVYYGQLVPNTALAKLGAGIPASTLAGKGLDYLANSLTVDPLTLATMAVAVLLAARRREARQLAAMAGVLLTLAYVVRVGGDFMTGRFLTAPFFVSLAVLSRARVPALRSVIPALVAVLVLGLPLASRPTWVSGLGYGTAIEPVHEIETGIADERGFYAPHTALLGGRFHQGGPLHPWMEEAAGLGAGDVVPRDAVGFFAFAAGPGVHVVDLFALGDPLLARLPAVDREHFRIGHFRRAVPPDYGRTVTEGVNRLLDPGLARLYDAILIVTRGPLFTVQRWREIIRLHTGAYDASIAAYAETLED